MLEEVQLSDFLPNPGFGVYIRYMKNQLLYITKWQLRVSLENGQMTIFSNGIYYTMQEYFLLLYLIAYDLCLFNFPIKLSDLSF